MITISGLDVTKISENNFWLVNNQITMIPSVNRKDLFGCIPHEKYRKKGQTSSKRNFFEEEYWGVCFIIHP